MYYVGEIKTISVVELKKQYPYLTEEDIKQIEGRGSDTRLHNKSYSAESQDKNFVNILYFEYKTFENQVYKIKQTSTGAEKAIEKTDQFNPPKDARSRFEKVNRSIEVLYEGAKIVGHENLLEWKKCVNMTRPKADITKVKMS